MGYSKIYLTILMLTAAFFLGCNSKQTINSKEQWFTHRGDLESSNYSGAEQIKVDNVKDIELAWSFNMNDMPDGSRAGLSQCTPIVVKGVMYTMSAKAILYALDAATGKQIWQFDPFDGQQGGGTVRGVAYWEKNGDSRILFGAGPTLIAVNAENGKPITDFGNNGAVDLRIGLRDDPSDLFTALTSPGVIYGDLYIVGGRLEDLYGSPPGYIRAYNVITGELTWTFHTIPKPGEPGYETWPKEAYKTAGGANNWAGMSVDTKRGLVFASLGSPSYDFYGADRLGQNLYGNCVLALDAATGDYVWHYQTVHHDLWDYDLPAPPNLVTLKKDGIDVDAVAQITKQGFVFVLNRDTGEPIFPIEEKSVPESFMPGEKAWPTQPFPTRPLPFARQYMTVEDLNDVSAENHLALQKQFDSLRYEGMYTPPDLKGTVMIPGTRGGAQWGGAAFDKETNTLYIRSMDVAELITIVERDPAKIKATSTIEQGGNLYKNYCAACHGANRQGNGAVFPELTNVKSRLSKEIAKTKITGGVGQMPGFSRALTDDEIESLLAFLYEEEDRVISEEATSTSQNDKIEYYNISGYTTWIDQSGTPAIKPPWGTLHSLDLSSGEYNWQIPLGNNPELQKDGAPLTGLEGKSGPIVTAGGLIFIGGAEDKLLRAIDKSNGQTLWEYELPAMANATACTYEVGGKQYVSISVGGTTENPSGSVMAFALK